MLEITENAAADITITWDREDDRSDQLDRAVSHGHLRDALRALGDPMQFARVAADDHQAKEELRSVSWLLDQLTRRRDALIVSLKDRRDADPDKEAGASWTDLVLLLDPAEPKPLAKRSKVQAMYDAGRRKTGLPAK